MKIIMNDVNNETEVRQSFIAVEKAIKDDIKKGRNNFKCYTFVLNNLHISVCKNKDSYATYAWQEEQP